MDQLTVAAAAHVMGWRPVVAVCTVKGLSVNWTIVDSDLADRSTKHVDQGVPVYGRLARLGLPLLVLGVSRVLNDSELQKPSRGPCSGSAAQGSTRQLCFSAVATVHPPSHLLSH